MPELPSVEVVLSLFMVDEAGRLIRRSDGKATWPADRKGYSRAHIGAGNYLTHRLAWVIHYGSWPAGQIDHVNGNKSDARRENLRIASSSQNACNVGLKRSNTSGFKGVCWDKTRNAWAANIRINGRKTTIGRFATADEAGDAYAAAAAKHHGEFARAGVKGTLPA